ncbi:MAG: hypothetical protein Q7R76_04960 [Candidatus Woesearchaeota archaeon]|nr:hypothetical protein [Candidatus Woesearchaeota archaeon]
MIIYNPHNEDIIKERIEQAEAILHGIPAKYCFITGSFLYKESYKDIDVFVLSRTQKKLKSTNKKVKITVLDFNDLYSLLYHSVSKSCIAKNILPKKPLKVTMSDYWNVINEAVPTLLNKKEKFHKNVRFLVLYTEYFKTGAIFDTFELAQKINSFRNYKEILEYIKTEVPKVIGKGAKPSYLKRFFYTQAGYYRDLCEYDAQNFLYTLTHEAAHGVVHG